MKSRADLCRQKADECERAATRVADPQVQASYRRMSRQWHQMAERQQAIDEALAERHKPLEYGQPTTIERGKQPTEHPHD